ncbi:acyl-CoA dehydrogenase C-terminal domain-containing protein [Novosphingobium album (ex Liu et al. 2023)]|uniref:Acyl-CoA dehydrogenase C-terminal domain-containing protein n=1 Tax=Novosphingobium album (ex Liu et al. 2023) TaxID=3031130 RepID=A0ABT5WP40_9SPHN|nr:acyl-CoA dehydrogenase C-terminal domain-containing protein [Novosphingobium album (ex Liu et al. 2023)]MDE8650683.1 acyl-CoA dehydrogenase C-terminal domain-containing protein [Novosphingobium album (ex Liu et al. 2023)]
MPSYRAPVRDARFVIHDVLKIADHAGLPGFAGATADIVDAVLEEAGKFAAEVLAPLNASGDREGCTRHADGSVTTPQGFREALAAFRESGWGTLSAPEAFGGQGMPHVIGFAVEEFMSSANMAFAMYPGLTNGAVGALLARGSEELQQRYLPKMVANEWLGTMNLTEPQCGTDLGLVRTRAEPRADGSYAITGTKIFISAGEHDLAANIIHLVLARTPDAPEGTRGISLFVVPKVLVNADGSLGARNALSCGAIERKMGIHANATCVMNYDGATGWLVGEENKGLAAMFIMMNAARLGVGIQGLAQAEAAYQNGAAYALERRQGRALGGPAEPGAPADPLVVHPDVRRMLMDARAFTEGMRALALWCGLLVDLSEQAASAEERQRADDLVGLLTPVIKGYGTDMGYATATAMQQVWGGHGYIVENGMEQFVRDARIAMIYEGANGVQGMDLVGRKLARDGGRAIQAFFAVVDDACRPDPADDAALAAIATRVGKANGELKAATLWFMQNALARPDNAGAGAYAYMHLMGIVALGLMWLRMARAATGPGVATADRAFLDAKLVTARYFADRFTPDAGALRRKIEAGADSTMALPAQAFIAG